MQAYFPGQRCISDTESELGLGMVLEFDGRRVTIAFAAVEESRTYVADNAPLTRLRFLPGDKIQSGEGWWLIVEQVEEDGPLLVYHGHREDGTHDVLPEQRLSERVQFNQPRERLLAGQIEHNRWFNARAEAQQHYYQLKSSPLHGLSGVRGELLPHQLYVAQTISERESPRVLLADEVGLGKTIEAGMVMHRMLLNERIQRVLVVVPEALQHQWLVEMLRRFNLSFSLFDAERLEAMRDAPEQEHLSLEEALMDPNFSLEPPENPFSEQQLVLCSMDFLCDPETSDLALDAGWDMLIVDEAHHLEWAEGAPSAAYQIIEQLAAETPSVLLLTATPEQLGNDSHFARLRLLDPDRYASLEQFKADQANYQQVAESAEPLLGDAPLSKTQQQALGTWLDDESAALAASPELDLAARRKLISTLVDRTGTGRVLMRNTRAAVEGFAPRMLHQHPLQPLDVEPSAHWWREDARVKWLIDTLRANYPRRYLLICSSADTALDLAEALRVIAGIVPAVFHEGMSILDCDRAAAHFADPESGAPVLICSEIGSEGRNFQFVSDLILFDLPDAPGLLEQRIGRLDRIGQRNTVNIHVPFLPGSREETLCQWYHRGLDAFEQTCTVGEAVLEDMGEDLQQLLANSDQTALDALIEHTSTRAAQLRVELESGRDKLLEMNSFDETIATALRDEIQSADENTPWEFFERAADCFGLEIEQLSSAHHSVQVGERSELPSFPGLGNDGVISVTCDRETALAREDVAFMSWEHPLVLGAMEMLVDGDQGKVSVGALKAQPFKAGEILIESIFAVHCQGAARLGFRRYMGHTLQRFLHTSTNLDIASKVPQTWVASRVETVKKGVARQLVESQQEALVQRIADIESKAEEQLPALRAQAQQRMHEELGAELKRMQALKQNNPAIRDDEIEQMSKRIEALDACLGGMQLRFDALRVIFCY